MNSTALSIYRWVVVTSAAVNLEPSSMLTYGRICAQFAKFIDSERQDKTLTVAQQISLGRLMDGLTTEARVFQRYYVESVGGRVLQLTDAALDAIEQMRSYDPYAGAPTFDLEDAVRRVISGSVLL